MAPSLGLRLVLTPSKGGGFDVDPLDLDFAAGRYALNSPYSSSFPAGWSFSRTGAGTALNSSGNVIQFATGVPRITNRGLLVEEARTNPLLWSQTFQNAYWTKSNLTATDNAVVAPDGTTTGSNLTTFSSFGQVLSSGVTITSGGSLTLSAFFKAGTASTVSLILFVSGSSFIEAVYNISTGVVTSGPTITGGNFSGAAASISAAGNGFYRCQLSVNTSGITSTEAWLRVYGGSGLTASVWGAQLEAGSFPTSLIITTGAAATRGADAAAIVAPSNVTTYTATYNNGLTATGAVTPSASFNLVTGRPWLGGYLQRIVMS
jgi:hypothetical protein